MPEPAIMMLIAGLLGLPAFMHLDGGKKHMKIGYHRFRQINETPDPDRHEKVRLQMEVLPRGEKWEWGCWWEFKHRYTGDWDQFWSKSIMGYAEIGGWRHPGPYEVRGVCRDQGEAWRRARVAANDARARRMVLENREMGRHTESFPL